LTDLMASDPDEAFEAVAAAVSKIENKFSRARIEVALFGKSGAEMDTVLKEAAGGFDRVHGPIAGTSEAVSQLGKGFEEAGIEAKNFGISALGAVVIGLKEMAWWLSVTHEEPISTTPIARLTPRAQQIQAQLEADTAMRIDRQELLEKLLNTNDHAPPEQAMLDKLFQAGGDTKEYREATAFVEKRGEERQVEAEKRFVDAISKDARQQGMGPWDKLREQAKEAIRDAERLELVLKRINDMEVTANAEKDSLKVAGFSDKIDEQWLTASMSAWGKLRFQAQGLIADKEKLAAVTAKINEMEDRETAN
jgi:hypothetical protein